MIKLLAILFFITLNCSTVFASNIKWHEQNNTIAHALGVVDARTETNSLEAFLQSYKDGHRVMEVDLILTMDDFLVARHDFEQNSYYILDQIVENENTIMSLERFTNEKICYKYTSLTFEDIVKLMNEYKDVYIVTDTKNIDEETIIKQFNQIVETAKNLNMENVLDRLIVQIYNEDMLSTIKNIYHFNNWIFTLYQLENPDYNKIADFCVSNNIEVVAIPAYSNGLNEVQKLTSKNIKVFTHTLNLYNKVNEHMAYGISGIYTDLITPSDMNYIDKHIHTNSTTKLTVNQQEYDIETYYIVDENYYNINQISGVDNFKATILGGNIYIIPNIEQTTIVEPVTTYDNLKKPSIISCTLDISGVATKINAYILDNTYYISESDLLKINPNYV